ncbi:MAG TPA: DUF397 domain-containing protein [Pseudonocardiaceae bacterium]|nr:DUF397 domain-containing protein [Pseudonocardiaceae bacterium]
MTTQCVGYDELARVCWIKSSYSGTGGGNCVQVAHLASGHRAVRDSKNPAGPVLILPLAGWATFTAGVRSGDLD